MLGVLFLLVVLFLVGEWAKSGRGFAAKTMKLTKKGKASRFVCCCCCCCCCGCCPIPKKTHTHTNTTHLHKGNKSDWCVFSSPPQKSPPFESVKTLIELIGRAFFGPPRVGWYQVTPTITSATNETRTTKTWESLPKEKLYYINLVIEMKISYSVGKIDIKLPNSIWFQSQNSELTYPTVFGRMESTPPTGVMPPAVQVQFDSLLCWSMKTGENEWTTVSSI